VLAPPLLIGSACFRCTDFLQGFGGCSLDILVTVVEGTNQWADCIGRGLTQLAQPESTGLPDPRGAVGQSLEQDGFRPWVTDVVECKDSPDAPLIFLVTGDANEGVNRCFANGSQGVDDSLLKFAIMKV
jgi:hypothetical protein